MFIIGLIWMVLGFVFLCCLKEYCEAKKIKRDLVGIFVPIIYIPPILIAMYFGGSGQTTKIQKVEAVKTHLNNSL